MQFNGGAEFTRALAQRVALGSSPCSPFDNDHETELEQFLTQFPL